MQSPSPLNSQVLVVGYQRRFSRTIPLNVSARSDDSSSLNTHESTPRGSGQSRARGPENMIFAVSKLIAASFLVSLLLIAWEDLSMIHPMRIATANVVAQPLQSKQELLTQSLMGFGRSTVNGMAFGRGQRESLQLDLEPEALRHIPSYNEVMLRHRTERVPLWKTETKEVSTQSSSNSIIGRRDVEVAVRTLQNSLVFLLEAKDLANNYEWDQLTSHIRSPILNSELEQACIVLKQAKGVLSLEARDEVGFLWGR